MTGKQQKYKPTEQSLVLFCECYKRDRMSIYDVKEFLECSTKTAKRAMQNIYQIADHAVFDVKFERDETTIYEQPVYLSVRDNAYFTVNK